MSAVERRPAARSEDPLAILRVIDRLEVGPLQLEPRRLTAPYRVVRDGAESSIDLVYRYDEDVFEPDDPAARNLAAMIAAQVALNYGLFCREIVLRGPFDAADRRLLTEMAANTAREIYVKKFLEHNPFLVGPAASLPAVKRESYLAADLVFPDADRVEKPAAGWAGDRSRFAVLASGGKDSLLSLGLLTEMGHETHSLFVAESGRHWLTALNAHRHLSATRPETTARVWTSSDRVFSAMLRHLPFVRPDFARVRADEYPIRLWTVAVFLFGALPLVRKRGVGRLVVGDEFDCTHRTSREGITHYDGLYDQSRYFDEALTRYFGRKGWGLAQFSILRPLSELLIQTTLVQRYPDLQRHQMSCHAAHVEEERVRPCGRCEKCRRIVGMLLAVGADPEASGYTEAQVRDCLAALAAKGAAQEAAGREQLARMLADKGLLPPDSPGLRARSRPEILSLRFHRENSPVESIPDDLRRPLYRILLQHARGAVERRGAAWAPVDPLEPDFLAEPYRFEAKREAAATVASPSDDRPGRELGRGSFLLAEMTWPEARERFRECDTALLPVGAIEQHGHHLPLDTDAWDADYLCREVAAGCSEPKPLVLPLIPYGVSYHHADFPGTLSVSPETLSRLVYEVGRHAARHGIKKLVIVNGHGGNAPTLQFAAQMINRDAHIFTCVDSGETSDHDIAEITETSNDVHAGEVETSTSIAARPQLVDMARARKYVPRFSSQYLNFSSVRSVDWYAYTGKISRSGVLGDPTKATLEKGERIWELMIRHLVAFVETLKGLTLEEIYQRRH